MQQKSIFILGGSMLQVPAIIKAKELGFFVYVLDYDPKAIGIRYADVYLEISTIDKQAVYEAALEYNPDFIITSTSDMPVRTVAWVNEKLGKKTDISYENSIAATDKITMRKRMKEHNVPVPLFFEIDSFDEFRSHINDMDEVFVLKPSDNAASRGVVFIDKTNKPNYKELYNYCRSFSRSGRVLIEEYMDGPEVSVESFSINGEPHVITITDKIITDLPFFVELGHTEPSRLNEEQKKDICNVTYKAIKAIGIVNGPSHTEIKVTKNGAKLVEIAARLGGDFITSKLVPLSTGVDLIKCSFDSLLGNPIDVVNKHIGGSAIRFIQGDDGTLMNVEGVDEALSMDGVVDVEIYKRTGENVKKPENSGDRIGHIIAIGKDAKEASLIAEKALKTIHVLIKS